MVGDAGIARVAAGELVGSAVDGDGVAMGAHAPSTKTNDAARSSLMSGR
jgi:hypothetical protein